MQKDHSFSASHVIFSKEDAEILDFGCTGRLTLSPEQEKYWQDFMSPDTFAQIFGPRRSYDLDREKSTMWLFTAVNGGLVNSAKLLTAYAAILLRHAWRDPTIGARQLDATEIDGMWHVEVRTPKKISTVLRLSRMTGRVCWLAPQPAS